MKLLYMQSSVHCNKELKGVRDYVENTGLCRRFMLLKYFDPAVAMTSGSGDKHCAVTIADPMFSEDSSPFLYIHSYTSLPSYTALPY